jgi:hypothetical protein
MAEQNPTEQNPTEQNNKLKLRKDGLYIQFGYRTWSNFLRTDTSDCWYNIIKVIDDDHYILLGYYNIHPFFEMDNKKHLPIELLFGLDSLSYFERRQHYCENINSTRKPRGHNIFGTKSNLTNKEKFLNCAQQMNLQNYYKNILGYENRFPNTFNTYNGEINGEEIEITYNDSDDFEVIKDYYSYLNLNLKNDNFDVLNIVTKLKDFDWNSLKNKIEIKGINYVFTHNYKSTDDDTNNDSVNITEPKYICGCATSCNDPFSLITYTDDTNSFYIKWSHCWVEGNCRNGGHEYFEYNTKEQNRNQIPFSELTNSFKFTFVPFDLSEKSNWIDEYIKWRERFSFHKFYAKK